MGSQPQSPEFRNNLENLRACVHAECEVYHGMLQTQVTGKCNDTKRKRHMIMAKLNMSHEVISGRTYNIVGNLMQWLIYAYACENTNHMTTISRLY